MVFEKYPTSKAILIFLNIEHHQIVIVKWGNRQVANVISYFAGHELQIWGLQNEFWPVL